jgi:murein DD-endopeptidase MepM/ murein hydrolase activator NlpD
MPAVLLSKPVDAPVSSGYGWRTHPVTGGRRFHYGIDYAVPQGTPVLAAAPGVVTVAGERGDAGRAVAIEHAHQIETVYFHNSQLLVSAGERVERGQRIALAGRTGLATGSHVHFGVKIAGSYVDPNEALLLGINGDAGSLNSLTVKTALATTCVFGLLLILASR